SPEEALTASSAIAVLSEAQPRQHAPLQVARRNGMPMWVEVSSAAIPWPGGAATLVTVLDLTAQKRAEDGLAASEGRWEQAEQVAQLGVWEYSVATRRSHWSTGMYGIFNIAPSAVAPAGLDFFPHVHPDDRQRMLAVFNESFRGGSDFSAEMRL